MPALADVHAVVGPTVPITPPRIEDVREPSPYMKANLMAARNTTTVNLLTMCAVTMPVALDAAGMPVGLHIVCPRQRGRPRHRDCTGLREASGHGARTPRSAAAGGLKLLGLNPFSHGQNTFHAAQDRQLDQLVVDHHEAGIGFGKGRDDFAGIGDLVLRWGRKSR